ncbi:uncharacterized protein LOC143211456 isoform X2 [Lasioglossum baleicum]|uniref:uncharacterized protein LOC143211456 isoform X2 n=1 Tax=Lasioglossum baleicum TaxID=434251 RepID=UPI003FCEAAA8
MQSSKITKDSTICELHFNIEDIIKEDAFVQNDGTIIYVGRKRAILKRGAVSSIFPPIAVPYCRQIEDSYNNESTLHRTPSTSYAINSTTQTEGRCVVLEEERTKFSKEDLSIARNIKVPKEQWLTNITDSYLMWTCWTEDLSRILRRVVLAANLKAQNYKVSRFYN